MGRSVKYVNDAEAVVFMDIREEIEYPEDWNMLLECIQDVLKERFPSLDVEDKPYAGDGFYSRELRIVLENQHASVVVSEYCGCMSLSLVSRADELPDGECNLAGAWCGQVSKAFVRILHERFPGLCVRRMGTMSNGVSVYERVGV